MTTYSICRMTKTNRSAHRYNATYANEEEARTIAEQRTRQQRAPHAVYATWVGHDGHTETTHVITYQPMSAVAQRIHDRLAALKDAGYTIEEAAAILTA